MVVGHRVDMTEAFKQFDTLLNSGGQVLQFGQGAAGPTGPIDHPVQAVEKLYFQGRPFNVDGDAPQRGDLQRLQIQNGGARRQLCVQRPGFVTAQARYAVQLLHIGAFQLAIADSCVLGRHLFAHVFFQVGMGLTVKVGAGFVIGFVLQQIQQRFDPPIDLDHALTGVSVHQSQGENQRLEYFTQIFLVTGTGLDCPQTHEQLQFLLGKLDLVAQFLLVTLLKPGKLLGVDFIFGLNHQLARHLHGGSRFGTRTSSLTVLFFKAWQ